LVGVRKDCTVTKEEPGNRGKRKKGKWLIKDLTLSEHKKDPRVYWREGQFNRREWKSQGAVGPVGAQGERDNSGKLAIPY